MLASELKEILNSLSEEQLNYKLNIISTFKDIGTIIAWNKDLCFKIKDLGIIEIYTSQSSFLNEIKS